MPCKLQNRANFFLYFLSLCCGAYQFHGVQTIWVDSLYNKRHIYFVLICNFALWSTWQAGATNQFNLLSPSHSHLSLSFSFCWAGTCSRCVTLETFSLLSRDVCNVYSARLLTTHNRAIFTCPSYLLTFPFLHSTLLPSKSSATGQSSVLCHCHSLRPDKTRHKTWHGQAGERTLHWNWSWHSCSNAAGWIVFFLWCFYIFGFNS